MQIQKEHIIGYLNGSLDKPGCEHVENWLALSKENREEFAQIKTIIEASAIDDTFMPDVDRAWTQVEAKISKKNVSDLTWVYKVAAMLVFALGIGVLSYTFMKNDLDTLSTRRNEIKEIVLPDGSRVILNGETEVKYDRDFDDSQRVVYLNGQAYFEIARDQNRPFRVIGELSTVEVLGTSFDFFSKKSNAVVNVTSGTVAFFANDHKENKATLTKNRKARLNHGDIVIETGLDEDLIAWRAGEMDFKSVPLREVVLILSKHYNVDFKLKGQIGNCLITSSFKDQNLEEALKTLEIIAGIKNKKRGKTINLAGPGC